MNTILLLVLALLPGIALLFFILFMDRNEKEPLGLVLKVILYGGISVAPAAFIEYFLGQIPLDFTGPWGSAFIIAFLEVAWIEELCKLAVVLLFAWKNKEFNEENDGIVYVGSSAMGFAMMENIFYVFGFGFAVGFLRAITAMPLHCFTGVLMGYYIGMARMEQDLKTRRKLIFKGFILAFMLHGFYDAFLLTNTPAGLLVFPMVAGLFIFGYKFMKKGRRLSIERGHMLQVIENAEDKAHILAISHPENQLWKIIISRSLLSLSIIFWIMTLVGIITKSDMVESEIPEVLMGGVLLSFLPILIGIMLEISYRRRIRLFHAHLPPEMKAKTLDFLYKSSELPAPNIPPTVTPLSAEVTPPGQKWRLIVGRALLTVSALFWAIIILAYISRIEDPSMSWPQLFIAVVVFSFFPVYIGILLEDSYRKRKKRYIEVLKKLPAEQISLEALSIYSPGQFWKIITSRTILGICLMLWVTYLLGGMTGTLNAEAEESSFLYGLVGLVFLTIIPLAIALLLEISFQKKKKIFQETYSKFSSSIITSNSSESKDNAENSNSKRISSKETDLIQYYQEYKEKSS